MTLGRKTSLGLEADGNVMKDKTSSIFGLESPYCLQKEEEEKDEEEQEMSQEVD